MDLQGLWAPIRLGFRGWGLVQRSPDGRLVVSRKAQANTASAEKLLPPAHGQGPPGGELLPLSRRSQEPGHTLPRPCAPAGAPRVSLCVTVTFFPGPS